MSVPLLSSEKRPSSFIDDGHPSLSISSLSGHRRGWPLHCVSAWHLSTAPSEQLHLYLTDSTVISAKGHNLSEIIDALEEGKGGKLVEHGPQFEALASSRAYIVSLDVEQQTVGE